jgi:hypothetical protein
MAPAKCFSVANRGDRISAVTECSDDVAPDLKSFPGARLLIARFTPADNLIGPRGGAEPIINSGRPGWPDSVLRMVEVFVDGLRVRPRRPDASPHYRRNAFLLG